METLKTGILAVIGFALGIAAESAWGASKTLSLNSRQIIDGVADCLRNEGVVGTAKMGVQFGYEELLRPFVPRSGEYVEYNGVKVDERRVLDSFVPAATIQKWEDKPEYEEPIVAALRAHVEPDDNVLILGGGAGVSATVAAESVADGDGHVTVYEAAQRQLSNIDRTLEVNDVADDVTVNHAIVEEDRNVFGVTGEAEAISAETLPECDVLEMDCEGAETAVLRNLQSDPRVIIVETHGNLDAPTNEVQRLLAERGYGVVAERPGMPEQDIYILTAVREDALPDAAARR
ncbi:FkbM family methyltransferase [Halorussus lipolyticus]|uniref:FkbM family methyltransferase n=1 Tax=Halorussus lipolyticus TaxID=3034024 RepID=UPI0023E77A4C|nr:FkbM family methyltransferase [Halorussus sp. DT80]